MYKYCQYCKTEKLFTEFYRNQGRCKLCFVSMNVERQRQLKIKSVKYKGGKCLSCGYSKYLGALEFHHLNPLEKEFALSKTRSQSWSRIKPELDKCILLCSNCHKEIHAGVTDIPDINNTPE